MSTHTNAVLNQRGSRADVIFRTEAGVNVGSIEFMQELDSVVDALSKSEETRFVRFAAEGKAFLAGANIKAMADYEPAEAREMGQLGHRVFDKIESLPQVTVAAIQGAALGGGCELALACDFRIAVKDATIGQPEVLLGLIPGWGGTQRLLRLVPHAMAKHMLLSGQSVSGEQAKSIGLVDLVVGSTEELGAGVDRFFEGMGKAGPQAVAALKRALQSGDEIGEFAKCFAREEAKQGLKAFLNKEAPPWVT